ncbi:MAG: hypothetical protein GQE15_04790 [Archangiaceae bacterium]|nr:hypothetical protein [Archangiaceae bacterium]
MTHATPPTARVECPRCRTSFPAGPHADKTVVVCGSCGQHFAIDFRPPDETRLTCRACGTAFIGQGIIEGTPVECGHCGELWVVGKESTRPVAPSPPARDAEPEEPRRAPPGSPPMTTTCQRCSQLVLVRGPAPASIVAAGCGDCGATRLDAAGVARRRAASLPTSETEGFVCPVCREPALVAAGAAFSCGACGERFQALSEQAEPIATAETARLVLGHPPTARAAPGPIASRCTECRGMRLERGPGPRSVPVSGCDRCGLPKLDGAALAERLEANRRRVAHKRVDFFASHVTFCLVCLNQRVRQIREDHFECSACGEVYDRPVESGVVPAVAPPVPKGRPDSRLALLERIAASPYDDGLRLSLGELYEAQGDPRAEFIALQLAEARGQGSPSARERIASLLERHGARWVPRGINLEFSEFRRGLLHTAYWFDETDVDHHAWMSVERLVIGALLPEGARAPFDETLRPALRELEGCRSRMLVGLLAAPPPKLEQLRLEVSRAEFVAGLELQMEQVIDRLPLVTRLGFGTSVVASPGASEFSGPNPLVDALVTRLRTKLHVLRVPGTGERPVMVQALLRRVAPELVVQLEFFNSPAGSAWLEVDTSRITLCTEGHVGDPPIEAMKGVMRAAGFAKVTALDVGKGERVSVSTR